MLFNTDNILNIQFPYFEQIKKIEGLNKKCGI